MGTRRALPRDYSYWDREAARFACVKVWKPSPSNFPWFGPVPRPAENFLPREVGGPSPNLTWASLACRDGSPYPFEWRSQRAARLAREYEAVRSLCGDVPIPVISGFRSAEWNLQIHGADKGQHVSGRAIDLLPPQGMTIDEFWNIILQYVQSGDSHIRGLGRYPGWVHLDIRPRRFPRVWRRNDYAEGYKV